jgi:hypothetical protein
MQRGEVVLFHTQPRGNSIDHLRIYYCRVDHIHSDPLRRLLRRGGLGETDHGVLRRNVNPYVLETQFRSPMRCIPSSRASA